MRKTILSIKWLELMTGMWRLRTRAYIRVTPPTNSVRRMLMELWSLKVTVPELMIASWFMTMWLEPILTFVFQKIYRANYDPWRAGRLWGSRRSNGYLPLQCRGRFVTQSDDRLVARRWSHRFRAAASLRSVTRFVTDDHEDDWARHGRVHLSCPHHSWWSRWLGYSYCSRSVSQQPLPFHLNVAR